MQIENGVGKETNLSGFAHQQFDGGLMIENHLRLNRVLPFGRLPEIDQPFGVEAGVGIPFQAR